MKNKAFSLIEVLIATLLLSMAILIITASLKLFFSYENKLEKYQILYMSVLSIVDDLSTIDLSKKPYGGGEINGIKYKYKAKLIEKRSNSANYLTYETENINQTGTFILYLYEVSLWIDNRNFKFYKTQYEKVKNLY